MTDSSDRQTVYGKSARGNPSRESAPPGDTLHGESLYGENLGIGAVVGSYEVVRQASEGGFSVVYEARNVATGKPAALKVLQTVLAAEPRMIERFYQEAAAVRRIDHPHVVTIHEYGELDDGRPYIAMEWLEGRTLAAELAARGPLGADQALAVLAELGAAVTAAHERGVIHRDLKAENIMALPRGEWFAIKLIDFGIAKFTGPEDRHTAFTTKTLVGTPATMAPEQILGEAVDQRTDVYAMGVLLYQMLTGALPFAGASAVEIEQMHLHARPPRASERAPVSKAVDQVIARALEKHPGRRHESAAELVADLGRALVHGEARNWAPERAAPALGALVRVRALGYSEVHADALGELLERACVELENAGLDVVLDTGDALLAAAALSGLTAPAGVVDAALRIHDRAVQAAGLCRVQIVVRVAAAVLGDDERVAGGMILDLGCWPGPGTDEPGVWVDADVPRESGLAGKPGPAGLFAITPGRDPAE